MKNIYYFIIVWAGLSFTLRVNAQPSWFHQPEASGPYTENPNYNNWLKIPELSDNFNETQLDNNKWFVFDYFGCTYNGVSSVKGDISSICINAEENILFNNDSQVPDQADVLILAVDPPNVGQVCWENYQGTNVFERQSNYTSGAIESQPAITPNDPTTYYNYGYYEANIKLPGWLDANSPSGYCGDGFHPQFWLVSGAPLFTEIGGSCLQTEIDIFEPGGTQYAYANFNEAGFHGYKPPCWYNCSDSLCGDYFCGTVDTIGPHNTRQNYKVARAQMTSPTALNLAYHNYAVEFLSDRIIFYFDRQPYAWVLADCQSVDASQIRNAFNIINPSTGLPFIMSVQFGNSLDGPPGHYVNQLVPLNTVNAPDPPIVVGPMGAGQDKTLWTNQSEWNMSVDSFYYWQLNNTWCGTSTTVYNESDLTDLINNLGVRQNITFDGSAGTINYPPPVISPTLPMDNITFRATDEIDIKPGFDAPEGSTLNLIITPCN